MLHALVVGTKSSIAKGAFKWLARLGSCPKEIESKYQWHKAEDTSKPIGQVNLRGCA